MTNYDYIMEHVSPREVALAMRPTVTGFNFWKSVLRMG